MSSTTLSTDLTPAPTQNGLTEDLSRKVEAAPLRSTPFDHVYLEGVFSPAQYQLMLDNMPALERFHELRHRDALRADGTSTRYRLYLYPEDLIFLPAAQRKVWLQVSRTLRSRRLQAAFKAKFREALEARFGKSIDRLNFYPTPILVCDRPGYRIGVHADALTKAMTIQFYLPADASQRHIGTIFHEGAEGEALKQTTAMSFLPSSGYAFAVTDKKSWHSVAQTSEADGDRHSLMLTYYVQERPLKWLQWRKRRLLTFFGRPPER